MPDTAYLFPRSPVPDDTAFAGVAFEWPGHFRVCLIATDAMLDRALPAFAAAVDQARGGASVVAGRGLLARGDRA